MSGGALGNPSGRQRRTIRSVRRADILLIACCLLAALLLAILFAGNRGTGSMAVISYDGKELYRIDLRASDAAQYYLILFTGKEAHVTHDQNRPVVPDGASYNLVAVADGAVTVEAADCRDQICVHHRPVTSARENIVCLPHKLVVELTGGGENTDSGQDTDSGEGSREPLDGVTR